MEKTITAPLAVIKINGVQVGKMKDVRLTENIQRGRVSGIGQMTADELPALQWTGTLSCSSYMVNINKAILDGSMNREVQNTDEWVDTVLFGDGIQVDVLHKTKKSVSATGVVTSQLEKLASVLGCFITREAFNISEGQISGRDADFEYITPVIFPQ